MVDSRIVTALLLTNNSLCADHITVAWLNFAESISNTLLSAEWNQDAQLCCHHGLQVWLHWSFSQSSAVLAYAVAPFEIGVCFEDRCQASDGLKSYQRQPYWRGLKLDA